MTANQNPTPEQARAALVDTLNAIEDKLNVPKRVGHAVDRGKEKVARLKRTNPGALIGGAAAIAVAAGGLTWAIVRGLTRR